MITNNSYRSSDSQTGLHAGIQSIWNHRPLIARLVQRELEAKYRGSALGALWFILTPVLMLAVYTLTFRVVFNARWSTNDAGTGEFALLLFTGLVVFNVFAESVARAPGLLLENSSYIKRVVFPLEILSVVSLIVALCNMAIGLVILGLFYVPILGVPPITALLLPLPLFPFCLFILGLSWFLASLGLFLRDVRHIIGVVVTALMFLSPVFYPISSLPPQFQAIMKFNPLAPILEQTRDLLFWGRLPSWTEWITSMVLGLVCAVLGLAWFLKTRRGFADVV